MLAPLASEHDSSAFSAVTPVIEQIVIGNSVILRSSFGEYTCLAVIVDSVAFYIIIVANLYEDSVTTVFTAHRAASST